MEKKLSEITRAEWIAIHWLEKPAPMGSDDRVFESIARRTPEEAARAAEDWDMTAEEREGVKI